MSTDTRTLDPFARRRLLTPWDRPGFAVSTLAPGELGPGRAQVRVARRADRAEQIRAACLTFITGAPPARHADDIGYDHFFRMSNRRLLSVLHRKAARDARRPW